MRPRRAQEPIKSLAELAAAVRPDLFRRWMAQAQKQALLAWRNRSAAPGLQARFERVGIAYYGWGRRAPSYIRTKAGHYPYEKTGRFRQAVSRRQPHSHYDGDVVRTTFAYGGSVMNALHAQRPVQSVARTKVPTTITVAGYARRRKGGGTAVTVKAYTYTTPRDRTVLNRGGPDYATAWLAFDKDKRWIERATDLFLRRIARSSAYNRRTGRIKSSVLRGSDG